MITVQMHGGLTTTHDGLGPCLHEIGRETGSSHRQTLDARLLKLQVSRCTDPDPPRRRCADGAALLVLPFLMFGLMIWPEPAFSDTSTVKFKPGGPPSASSNDKRPDIMYGVYSPFVPGPDGKCVVGFLPEVKGGVPSCRPTSLQAAQREATRMIDSARQAATSSAREGMRREQASQQRAANKYKTDAAANKYETEKDRAPASTSAEPSPATTLSAPTPAAGEPAAPAAAKKEAAGSKDLVPAAAKKKAAVSKDYALFERKRILLEAREAQSQMKQKITAVSEADIYRNRNKALMELKGKLEQKKKEEEAAAKAEEAAARKREDEETLKAQERQLQKAQEEEIKKQLEQGMDVPLDTTPTRELKKTQPTPRDLAGRARPAKHA